MHKSTLFSKSISFSLVFLCLVVSKASLASPKGDIRQLEQDFNAAYAVNDFDKYFGYYADDAVLWFPEGRTDIPRYKKMWSDFLKSGGAIKAASLSDMHIRFSPRGDVATASYILHLTTQEANKKVHTDDHQESDVWFKTDGSWKIAHVHYSDVPVPAKP